MPSRVYRGKSAYEYHPRTGGAVRLCELAATESDVWMAYRAAVNAQEMQNCSWLAQEYFKSPRFKKLSERTKRDYMAYWKRLNLTFGKQLAVHVKPSHVREYMDKRGLQSEAMANKEFKLFSLIMAHGVDRCYIKRNPCKGRLKYQEKPRTKYITDQEYQSFYGTADPTTQVFMELAYICAARGQDIRKLTMADIREEGLFIRQAKTGKAQIKLWNDRLRAVVDRAKEIRRERNQLCTALLVSEAGGPFTEFGLKSLWRRAKRRYSEATGTTIDWTFHDIKAKGISDFQGDKQTFSGHKSRAMMERYNRDVDKTTVIDFKRGKAN